MAERRARPALSALLPPLVVVAAVVALAACRPITRAPRPAPVVPPATTACAAASTSEDQPTASKPVEYSAVVDPAGAPGPEVETFVAASPAEREQHVRALDDAGDVLAVDVTKPVQALGVTPDDDPRYGGVAPNEQKVALDHVGFPAAWAKADGTGVKIAVIDSGVDATHPDLVAPNKVTTAHDFYPGQPLFKHGTHVAGIAAAVDNTLGGIGGAPGASILSYRVLDRNGSGSSSNVARAIFEAVFPGGANVINLSLGGGPDSAMQTAVRYATQHGVVVVAAAGNNGSSCAVYPAAYPETIAVAALKSGTNVRASFSNYGSSVDLAAPGDPVDSTLPAPTLYGPLRGTSMATPFVSAVAALVKSKCTAYTAAQVRNRIESTALNLSPYQVGLGHGRVRADQAVPAAC